MREKLIEIIKKSLFENINYSCNLAENIADDLIADGVIVPPCKVGDTVYRIYTRSWIGEDVVREVVVSENGVFYVDDKGRMTSCDKFGKTVFLSREEAEKALEGEAE